MNIKEINKGKTKFIQDLINKGKIELIDYRLDDKQNIILKFKGVEK